MSLRVVDVISLLVGKVSKEFVMENIESPENVNVEPFLERLGCVETLFPLTVAAQEKLETTGRTTFRCADVISDNFLGQGVVGGALSSREDHDLGTEPQRLTSTETLPIDRGMMIRWSFGGCDWSNLILGRRSWVGMLVPSEKVGTSQGTNRKD